MKKGIRAVLCALLAAIMVWLGSVAADRQRLSSELIRLHVLAASDSDGDQSVKLAVRDALVASLREGLAGMTDMQAAESYLRENLPRLEALANETLEALGVTDRASVSLCREAFETRVYDTFSLPAGVYEALRVCIGSGEGKNWWCVVFPALCLPQTAQGFSETAEAAGFPSSLTDALTGEDGYTLRFYVLDKLGQLQNLFFEK